MKLFTFVVLFTIVASCYGYSYLIPASIKHPGICYYNGHMLPKGDNQMPTTCQNMKCNEDGSILVQGCGHMNLKECTLMGLDNLHKPYPDCCEMTYQCKDKDGKMYTRNVNTLKMPTAEEMGMNEEQNQKSDDKSSKKNKSGKDKMDEGMSNTFMI